MIACVWVLTAKFFRTNTKANDGLEWILTLVFFGTQLSSISVFPTVLLGLRNDLGPNLFPIGGQYLALDILISAYFVIEFTVDWNFVISFVFVVLLNASHSFKWLRVLTSAW